MLDSEIQAVESVIVKVIKSENKGYRLCAVCGLCGGELAVRGGEEDAVGSSNEIKCSPLKS